LIAYSPFLLLVAFFFLLNIFLSLKGLNVIKTSFPRNVAKIGLYSSLGILIITAIGGIAFEVILSDSGAQDWWLSSGFFAGIIGGLLLPILYYFSLKNPSAINSQETSPSPPRPN